MKKWMSMMLIALFSAAALSGCNTVGGAGEDISEGGQSIQDAAN